MRNKIDFSLAPEDLFFDPASDSGMFFVEPPAFVWRARPPGRIEGFAASEHDNIRLRTERFIRQTRHHKTFRKGVEFKTALVLLEGASYRKSFAMVGGKCLLNGASGIRLLNRYCWENEEAADNPEARLVRYFSERQSTNRLEDLPLLTRPLPPGVDFAIECRNTFNFYHFVTETLCHICLLDSIDFEGRIYIHFPNAEDKTRPFVLAFVEALFPHFRGRIVLERAPKEYTQVLTAYNFFNSYYHLPPEVTAPLDALAPSDEMWKGAEATRSSQAVLSMNSIDSSLVKLREHALAAIREYDASHLPRRFYVGRKPGASRDRAMEGEDKLLEFLAAFGFAQIAFEDLSPLDQIALMAHAEVMISPHGAGFANMIFANPDALVIELGTLQTAVFRWGDFWPLAMVSGCRYVSFFADYKKDDPTSDPAFAADGIVPVALGRRGLGEVLAFVAASLGHFPRLARAEDLSRLLQQLVRTGQPDRALGLFEAHRELARGQADLLLALAEIHKGLGAPHAELVALTEAWQADTSRWQTLVQLIWCARKLGKTEVLAWAVNLLAELFPERCLDLGRDRPWIRELL